MYGNHCDVSLWESQIENPNWFLRPVLAKAKWLHICDFAFVLLRHNFNVHFKFLVLQIRWRDDWRKTNDNKTFISFLTITSWSRCHFKFLKSFDFGKQNVCSVFSAIMWHWFLDYFSIFYANEELNLTWTCSTETGMPCPMAYILTSRQLCQFKIMKTAALKLTFLSTFVKIFWSQWYKRPGKFI